MDANLIVSISAVAVAVIALVTAIWQGAVARQHNKLSVKPHLIIDHVQHNGVTDRLILRNNGLGPAVIRSLEVFVDGSMVVGNGKSMESVISALGLELADYEFYHPSAGEGYSVGSSHNLMSFKVSENSNHDKAVLKSLKDRMIIKIKYESIYKDTYCLEGIG